MINMDSEVIQTQQDYIAFKARYKELLTESYVKQNPRRGHGDVERGRLPEHFMIFNNAKLNKKDIVLEFGAWSTFFSIMLANEVKELITTDSFTWTRKYGMGDTGEDMNEQQWLDEINGKNIPNLKAEYADIQATHYPDKYFSKVISISVLEHVEDDLKALNEIARILKDDGLVCMTTEFTVTNKFKAYENEKKDKTRGYTIGVFKELVSRSNLEFAEPLLPTMKDEEREGDPILYLQ